MNFIDGAAFIFLRHILKKKSGIMIHENWETSHCYHDLILSVGSHLLVHAQFSDELGEQVVQGTFVFLVFAVKVGGQHEDDLHVGDGLDTSDVVQLREVLQ